MATLELGTISNQSWYELATHHTEKIMLKESFHQAHISNAKEYFFTCKVNPQPSGTSPAPNPLYRLLMKEQALPSASATLK